MRPMLIRWPSPTAFTLLCRITFTFEGVRYTDSLNWSTGDMPCSLDCLSN